MTQKYLETIKHFSSQEHFISDRGGLGEEAEEGGGDRHAAGEPVRQVRRVAGTQRERY